MGQDAPPFGQDAIRDATFLVLALTALALAGCEDAPFRLQNGWTEERVLSYTWLTPRSIPPEPAYCYKTLAQADCYTRPQPRYATRLEGYLGPQPF